MCITSTTGWSHLCRGRKWCFCCHWMFHKLCVRTEQLFVDVFRHLSHPMRLWCDAIFVLLARVVGESIWKTLETHSNKTNTILKVLKPDTTYQVKVQVQCLSKVHSTNDFVTLRTPEGCKCYSLFLWQGQGLMGDFQSFPGCSGAWKQKYLCFLCG